MAAATLTSLFSCNSKLAHTFNSPMFVCAKGRIFISNLDMGVGKGSRCQRQRRFLHVFAATQDGSSSSSANAKSRKSEENIPSWANPDSDEPPPWARDEAKGSSDGPSFQIPFYVYLLASAITAIAAIGSAFEYVNQRPVFGILKSDSIFYAPVLGFFAFTGIPTSAVLWFKSVQAANKEAEEQDRRDGYL